MSARTVVPNHTEQEIKEYVDTGERLLREAGYDDAERLALMPTIINLLSSKTVYVQQPVGGAFDLTLAGGKVRQ